MIKDTIAVLEKITKPVIGFVGTATIVLFAMTLIPALSYIPKTLTQWILIPYIFAAH